MQKREVIIGLWIVQSLESECREYVAPSFHTPPDVNKEDSPRTVGWWMMIIANVGNVREVKYVERTLLVIRCGLVHQAASRWPTPLRLYDSFGRLKSLTPVRKGEEEHLAACRRAA